MPKRRPFHDSIIDIIKTAANTEISILAILLKTTKIPKNHDEIIEAWKNLLKVRLADDSDLFGVVEDILKQKQEIEKKEGDKFFLESLDGR